MRLVPILFYGATLGGIALIANHLEAAAPPAASDPHAIAQQATMDQAQRAAAFRLKLADQPESPSAGYAVYHHSKGEHPLPV